MQVPKRHLPVVGLLGLIVIAAAGGTVYYYQFFTPHQTTHGPISHRLIFMTATVYEEGGFRIYDTAYLNQTSLPSADLAGKSFNASIGPVLAGLNYTNYKPTSTDNQTINANVGDTLTFFIRGVNATHTAPLFSDHHGFTIDIQPQPVTVTDGQLGGNILFGKWYTVSFTVSAAGLYEYRCTVFCSNGHPQMFGNIIVS